jgi:tRNA (cmo5U34)-methyltransferase
MNIPTQWTFESDEVAKGFDSHVREQLPWYDMATWIVAHVVNQYLPIKGTVYDIGASTGNIGNAIKETIESRQATYIPIDNSPNMKEQYKGIGELIICNAEDYEYKPFDVCVIFLCLMFIQPCKRKQLIESLKAKKKEGGAIIIFDKFEPQGGYCSTVSYRLTLAMKLKNGATPDEIISKELSLSGIQRPLNNIDVQGGYEVFRFGDFAGFIL